MHGELGAEGLISTAIALLEAEVLPGLVGDQRFKALMSMSALRMAERERKLAEHLRAAQEAVIAASGATSLHDVCRMLRKTDVALDARLHAVLIADALVRTAVTKPAALTAGEREDVGV